MNDFEKGFFEELAKIAQAKIGVPKPPSLKQPLLGMGAKEPKTLAKAISSPLSKATSLKPPKQDFFVGG